LKLKFPAVAEKRAKNFRGLLYFAAPDIQYWLFVERVTWQLCLSQQTCTGWKSNTDLGHFVSSSDLVLEVARGGPALRAKSLVRYAYYRRSIHDVLVYLL